jgi:acyl-coenzyme A thioesterase PaaI-like protein
VTLVEAIGEARQSGDLAPVVARIPYMGWMGIEMRVEEARVVGCMRRSDHLIGNYVHRALHGGTLGALLESTAVFALLYGTESESLPRIVNITVEYLRSG